MTTYLCGGINGLSDADCKDWREVAKAGLATPTLDPIRRDYRGREDESVGEIVQGDLEDISSATYLLVNATRPTWGTAMELVYAKQAGKFVVAFTEGARVSPWLRAHSDGIVVTVEEAIAIINQKASDIA